MPRILDPVEPRGPGQVIELPRPRNVGPVAVGLPAFGAAVGDAANMLLQEAVRQERRNETLRIRTEAEQRYGELRRQVDEAGTSADGRAIWQQEGPKVDAELKRLAEQRGMPELSGELEYVAAQHNSEVLVSLGRRAHQEAADAVEVFVAGKLEAMVAAAGPVEAKRHEIELHRTLQELAQDNPLLTPGAADVVFNETVNNAAIRRVQRSMALAADNPSALRTLAADIRGGAFERLPADSRDVLAARADEAAQQAELHALAMQDQMDAQAERIAKRAREANEIKFATELARGEATIEDLTAALGRREIDVAFYDRSLRFMREEAAGIDDPHMALVLRAGAYDGTVLPTDVMSAPLTQQTKEELLNIIGTRSTDGPLHRDDVKRARRFLIDSIAGPRGPLGQLLDPDDVAREAAAVREFDARILAGHDAWVVADEMVPQFRVGETKPLTTIGRPRYLVGTLLNPDVPATAQALLDAFERGEIDEETLEREIDRLERLGDAATDAQMRREAAKAAAEGRR